MFGWLRCSRPDPIETRSAAGFTQQVMEARASYISGNRGMAELTATAQACVGLWEGALAAADVQGTDLLRRADMALLGRLLALRGEALFYIGDVGLVPASAWDVTTRNSRPRAYRLTLPEASGPRSVTVLASEVLHVRIGSTPETPWAGTAPLRRASLTADLLATLEGALAEVYAYAPLGSQIIPFPEARDADLEALGRGFRGRRGRVLLRESVSVTAAGGPQPAADWRPSDTTPDLSRAMTTETLDRARDAICSAFGVLPALFNAATTGPMVREAQRHLATWILQPIAAQISEEVTAKLGTTVEIDTLTPLQAFDAGGSARAVSALIGALAQAKEAGLAPAEVAAAFAALDWSEAQA